MQSVAPDLSPCRITSTAFELPTLPSCVCTAGIALLRKRQACQPQPSRSPCALPPLRLPANAAEPRHVCAMSASIRHHWGLALSMRCCPSHAPTHPSLHPMYERSEMFISPPHAGGEQDPPPHVHPTHSPARAICSRLRHSLRTLGAGALRAPRRGQQMLSPWHASPALAVPSEPGVPLARAPATAARRPP